MVSVKFFFNVSVINFAVPSAVFKAMFPVKPSVTITFVSPSIILLASKKPLNSKSFDFISCKIV